jgi:cytochrome P450
LAFDPERFSSADGVSIPAFELPWKFLPVECDPPIARDYRKILNKRSSPSVVAGFEDVIRATVVELIDEFIADGEVDLAQRLFIPAPAVGLAHFLGLEPDRERWHGWASRVVGLAPDPASLPEIMAYFDQVYEDRTAEPRDDLPSDLLVAEVEGGRRLTRAEWLGIIAAMFFGGLETTSNAASHILWFLHRNPEIRAAVASSGDGLPGALEELLRLTSPAPHHCRTTTGEVHVAGQRIPAGERVMLWWIAANRDPREFSAPGTFDPSRPPNQHVAFGAGVHRCIGLHLARLELRVLFEEVLRRMPDFAVDDTRVVQYGGITRGIESLPVTFTRERPREPGLRPAQ